MGRRRRKKSKGSKPSSLSVQIEPPPSAVPVPHGDTPAPERARQRHSQRRRTQGTRALDRDIARNRILAAATQTLAHLALAPTLLARVGACAQLLPQDGLAAVFAVLFDMNALWEHYVGWLFRRPAIGM